MDRSNEPVACTLSTKDAAQQVLEWTDLRGRTLSIEPLVDGAVMTFADDLADDVDDLAAREAACCEFLTITTTRQNGIIRLEITADDPSGVGVVDLIAGTTRA